MTTVGVDVDELEAKVKDMYRQVAEHPEGAFHFELGAALAVRLGYDAARIEALPHEAVDSFAGVGFALDLAALEPGETVLDLGSGSGMDVFYAPGSSGRPGGWSVSTSRSSSWPRRAGSLRRTRRSSSARGTSRRCPWRTTVSTASSPTA